MISSSSIEEIQPRGSLETDGVYITEQLLRTFSGISGRPEFFFRSIQAGFSVNIREPSSSVCGCNRTSEGVFDSSDFGLTSFPQEVLCCTSSVCFNTFYCQIHSLTEYSWWVMSSG